MDNNCSGEIDEDALDALTWYPDRDADGYGDSRDPLVACSATAVHVLVGGDCDDTHSTTYPDAPEICDGRDNDCDDTTDEDVIFTWYIDGDGDGYGDPSTSTEACSAPAGYSGNDLDCLDSDPSVHPGGIERCDGLDNDCNDAIDDEAIDTTTWYTDADGDGYGSPDEITLACDSPDGMVESHTDCDDSDEEIHPAATEVCDTVDNDCDGATDEGVTLTLYPDVDGDGYGDPDGAIEACASSGDYTGDDTDCDDAHDTVHPGADEVCDTLDNDCNGSVDDEAIDSSTWYPDVDGDGLGDSDLPVESCEAPSGHVDNGDDCDDSDSTDALDLDGDGLSGCIDTDDDGDGLRDEWDADPNDASIVRGPAAGLGTDGDITIEAALTQPDYARFSADLAPGATTIAVSAPFLAVGDEVLIIGLMGDTAGAHQYAFVSALTASEVTLEPPLSITLDADTISVVQRVPHYGEVLVEPGGSLAAVSWASGGSGVVVFRATGSVLINGSIHANEAGYSGGSGVVGHSSDPQQGESYKQTGTEGITSPNDGGGGAYPTRADRGDGGGGGGYGSTGRPGTEHDGTPGAQGGDTYGGIDLVEWFLGSGGGGGSPDAESDGAASSNVSGWGGHGGGIIAIYAGDGLTVAGTISADGQTGGHAVAGGGGEVGGGGGGSGGQILLAGPTITISGSVTAHGSSGGMSAADGGSPYGAAYGGDGGDGRIRLEFDSLYGASTAPPRGSDGPWLD